MDCDEAKDLCSKYGVKGFPTLKFFGEDKKAAPKDYGGARDAAGIEAFVRGELGSGGSSLVRSLGYLDVYTFLGEKIPSVIHVSGSKSPPSWLASLAVKFKEGKVKKAQFAHVHADAHPGVGRNFGVASALPALLLVVPLSADEPEGYFVAYDGPSAALEKGAAAVKEVKDFISRVLDGGEGGSRKGAAPLPSFPPPDVPRKVADISFAQLSADNLDSACLDSRKSVCAIALVAAAGDEFPQKAELEGLAKRFRNDPISFVFYDPSANADFAAAFGLSVGQADSLPKVRPCGPSPRPAAAVSRAGALALTAAPAARRRRRWWR